MHFDLQPVNHRQHGKQHILIMESGNKKVITGKTLLSFNAK